MFNMLKLINLWCHLICRYYGRSNGFLWICSQEKKRK